MKRVDTPLKGCFIIEPAVFKDERGYFFESYNQEKFEALLNHKINFVQDNESKSQQGTLRGLHMQKGAFAQAKLVRVIQGEVLDVAVDLRKDAPTYGQYFSVLLSEENKKQLFVPRGFAHGFVTLSKEAVFSYKCDNNYNKASEVGIAFDDVDLDIDWQYDLAKVILSEKDKNNISFQAYTNG
jgi:dTDP-4-dehydrorhamnose 3,5-epimerase